MSLQPVLVALGLTVLVACGPSRKSNTGSSEPTPYPFPNTNQAPAGDLPAYTLNGNYGVFVLNSWNIHMNQALIAQKALALRVVAQLTADLSTIQQRLPSAIYSYLVSHVHIYLELNLALVPGGAYHPSASWLTSNGYSAEWAKNIQLGNANNYLSWTKAQPAMVLHELSHAWQDQYWGTNDGFILTAYQNAMNAHLYDSVRYVDGTMKAAYATTNYREYFAELSEAWFWKNDFFPTVQSELTSSDPTGAAAIRAAWLL